MFESSLSKTSTALEQLFCHTTSRFRSYRSSARMATAEVAVQKKHDVSTQDTAQQDNVTSTGLNFKAKLPSQAWDSHMHVLDPRFPLSPSAVYVPSSSAPTKLKHAQHFESGVGLDNIVLVQPSIYGYDNSCLLDALRTLGPDRARGVVAFEDPAAWAANEEAESHQILREWHELGVRGVRINLQSVGSKDVPPEDFRAMLQRYIDVVRPFGWVVQLYVAMDMVHILEPLVRSNNHDGFKLCIDHMGHPHVSRLAEYQATRDPYTIPGFDALVRLLDTGKVFVKMSAAYRFSAEMATSTPPNVWPIATELLRVAGHSRVVFATDWPHTRFDGLDIRPWIQSIVDMCSGDEELIERVFRGNAEDLWSVERQ
ncbi:hypothetical protein Micbo1qcDRAFT_151220 [Microdochium bolleyi]|uniref:Amidohydrolase-related domain-containing protein n=1 Tax=Microdochium bolleyi TaxID=196109 RepID=A0A136IT78_9PEZI|nr:hypothetical protein Micbo1qcDRAFT_151220 [Microdochium bolleyi]